MKNEIEWTAEPRTNVSERRADFYRSLPDRIETGTLPEAEMPQALRELLVAKWLLFREGCAQRRAARRAEGERLRNEYPEYPIPDPMGRAGTALALFALGFGVLLCIL